MSVPIAHKVAHVGYRDVHALILAALDKGGKTIVIAPDIDELPVVFAAYRFQVVDILCLKGLVIYAGVAAGRKFMCKLFFEFFEFSHCF